MPCMAEGQTARNASSLRNRSWLMPGAGSPDRYRGATCSSQARLYKAPTVSDAAEYLAAHIHEAPVWIVPCLEGGRPTRTSGSSIYPAVQNMLLGARALGLGATLTTLYLQFEKEAEAALGLPPGVHSYALVPIGYPMGRFGPVRRIALADVVYEDRWGQAYRDL
jgi:nitroreductase